MKKIFVTLSALLAITLFASAQYVDQALMFSQQYYGSTARSKAMGNAFGALGGDFSSLSINPAGVAVFRSSEMSFTPTVMRLQNTDATYGGIVMDDSKYKFNLRNFGYVGNYQPQASESGVVGFNFGLGFNRVNDFNMNSLAQAFNSPHSRMDAFAQNTNGIYYDDLVSYDDYNPYYEGIPWQSKLAWETYLLEVANPDEEGDLYNTVLYEDDVVDQHYSVEREGYTNEYVFSLGANFNHKIYIGATIGIQDLFMEQTTSYGEWGAFGSFDYTDYLRTSGLGYNFKFGAIWRPVPELRLGAAFHTPTFYDLKETYYSSMESDVEAGLFVADTPEGNYRYDLETPFRAIFSAALAFGKTGLISADYEYADYSKMKLRRGEDGYDWYYENAEIKEIYNATHVIRLGAEIRPTPNVSLRAGYEHYGNPYNGTAYDVEQPNRDYSYATYNTGIGFRFKNGSFDIAYSLRESENYNFIYQVDGFDIDPVKYETMVHELMFTLAFKF